MIDLASEETRRNPYALYRTVRALARVVREPTTGLWLALDYESVRETLQNHESFSSVIAGSGGGPGRWPLFSDPPRHTRLRALVSKAFTPRVVTDLEPRIRKLSRDLLAPHIPEGQMDLVLDYAVPLPLCVIAEMLGVPAADWRKLRQWSDIMMGMIHTLLPGSRAQDAVAAYRTMHAEITSYVTTLGEERRSKATDDLLSRLVHAEVDGDRLSDEDLVGFFELLLLAGHETTTNLIGNMALCLFEYPENVARLKSDTGLRASAIEEVLRYRSPVQMMGRVALRDVELGGQPIPQGSKVFAVIGAANRDPAYFPDADRFDIARDPNPHIAFGQGIHFCIGAPLARLEGRIALDDLLELRGLARIEDGPWEPREAFHVHGPARLPVRFEANAG
ncbi:MAG TPA: cytochrome P450 [Terriglobia bacterium]|nr:cytochrome P450 [Terriglobia bacterium]